MATATTGNGGQATGSDGLMGGVCCKCGAIRILDGVWVRLPGIEGVPYELTVRRGEETLVLYRISHGYCPTCTAEHLIGIIERRAKRREVPR